MIRFAHPEFLYILYVLPLLAGLIIWQLNAKKKALGKIAHVESFSVLFKSKSFVKDYGKAGLLVMALGLIILGFANPQIGTRIEDVKQVGIDVYICLDVSMSMKAEDLKPNRLEKAKKEISELIKKLQGDRIGLIVFAGGAYVQFPLTADYSAANLFLSSVDVNSVPEPGTAIASAINLAVDSFDKKSATRKVIVVITDGEDHEGDISKAVSNAKENNIVVDAIGMGSPDGAPIPMFDGAGKQTGFKQDNQGNTVLTKLDEVTLRQLANESGGKYYLALNNGNELDAIYRDLASVEKTEFGMKKVTDYDDKFYYFLIPALLILISEFFISDKKVIWLKKLMVQLRLRSEE
jgi:Ca-activated chloride channel family protein